jgi:hypothetical protein
VFVPSSRCAGLHDFDRAKPECLYRSRFLSHAIPGAPGLPKIGLMSPLLIDEIVRAAAMPLPATRAWALPDQSASCHQVQSTARIETAPKQMRSGKGCRLTRRNIGSGSPCSGDGTSDSSSSTTRCRSDDLFDKTFGSLQRHDIGRPPNHRGKRRPAAMKRRSCPTPTRSLVRNNSSPISSERMCPVKGLPGFEEFGRWGRRCSDRLSRTAFLRSSRPKLVPNSRVPSRPDHCPAYNARAMCLTL